MRPLCLCASIVISVRWTTTKTQGMIYVFSLNAVQPIQFSEKPYFQVGVDIMVRPATYRK